ncbi:hypothetical protein BCU26_016715 [Vibrio splendidus]|jgi:hypothetical protein|uniref:hypothetical protein n=1 Tax=Vibrio TaxID=662 RepID=UPI000C850A64|nr:MULTISPECIES: hypothetical protein [Vibrio]PMH68769.1 hypothetical protein BCU61_16910 [Vibrio splendidus]PMJ31767.1 hypothetical protein BCU26_02230 [Vibrio splendidus]PMN22118.1 hypothetical protein BCT37_12460 [Vibrio cyclitrophicus]
MKPTTLQKLALHYKTVVKHNQKALRNYVEIQTDTNTYFVVCNDAVEDSTLLVATDGHNDYVKVSNNNKTFEALKTLFDERISEITNEKRRPPAKKAVELFGELFEV